MVGNDVVVKGELGRLVSRRRHLTSALLRRPFCDFNDNKNINKNANTKDNNPLTKTGQRWRRRGASRQAETAGNG